MSPAGVLPTAPVAAGEMVFIADRAGVVRALDLSGKEVWKAYTSGPVYYPPAIANDRVYVGSADGRVYAYAARSGRLLWTFRVAPEDRWIPIYGDLINRWPVAGGVVVEDGTVYARSGNHPLRWHLCGGAGCTQPENSKLKTPPPARSRRKSTVELVCRAS